MSTCFCRKGLSQLWAELIQDNGECQALLTSVSLTMKEQDGFWFPLEAPAACWASSQVRMLCVSLEDSFCSHPQETRWTPEGCTQSSELLYMLSLPDRRGRVPKSYDQGQYRQRCS
jgi:hypothetical protein